MRNLCKSILVITLSFITLSAVMANFFAVIFGGLDGLFYAGLQPDKCSKWPQVRIEYVTPGYYVGCRVGKLVWPAVTYLSDKPE